MLNSEIFTLIAYKPSGDDYCQGCRMATYHSEYYTLVTVDTDILVKWWTQKLFEDKFRGCNEPYWKIQIFSNGLNMLEWTDIEGFSYEEYEKKYQVAKNMEKMAQKIADEKFEEYKKVEKENEIQKKIKLQEKKEIEERKQLEELKKKYKD